MSLAKWIRLQADPDPFCLANSYRQNGTRDEHKHLNRKYEKQICSYFLNKHLISLQLFSKYTLVSGLVLNIFNMVISRMNILHLMYDNQIWSNYKYERKMFYSVFKKLILAILIHFAWRIHSACDIYIFKKTFKKERTNYILTEHTKRRLTQWLGSWKDWATDKWP